MTHKKMLGRGVAAALLAFVGASAHAQFDYAAYGVLDFSYGRFEPSGRCRSRWDLLDGRGQTALRNEGGTQSSTPYKATACRCLCH